MHAPHWPLAATLPLALLAAAFLGAYWWRLGLPGVPARRRRVRRAGNVFLAILLTALVIGLSVVDASYPAAYVVTWLVACFALMGSVACAFIDAVDNLRHLAANEREETRRAIERLKAEHARDVADSDDENG